jgi:hypothetical protein
VSGGSMQSRKAPTDYLCRLPDACLARMAGKPQAPPHTS